MEIKLFALLLLASTVNFAAAQEIPNANFESWTNGSPDDWDTSNEDLAMFSLQNISQETNAPYEGESSLLASSIATAFFTLSGVVCNGTFEGPNPSNNETETIKGVPFSSRPAALNLWYKCEPMENDSSLIAIHLFKEGNIIGQGELIQKDGVSEWTNISIPVQWTEETEPDTMLILIKSSYGTTDDIGGAVANSKIWIDDLKLTYGVTNIQKLSSNAITVYPNPFTEYLYLDLDNTSPTEVTFYNLNGQTVAVKNIVDNQVNTSFLERGIYLVQINNNGFSYSYKLIKQ